MAATYTFSQGTLPFHTDFQLAGARCFLSTNSHQVLRAAERWRWETTDPAGTFEMQLIVDSKMNAVKPRGGHFRGLRHLVFASLPPQGFLVYDLLRRRVTGVLSPCAMQDDAFWNTFLMPITIGIMGTTMGVAPLHCACLDRKGDGILLAGISGAGKSTLTAALGQRGFAVVSDDWTYVTTADNSLVGHGLGAPIKLLPDAAQFFPNLRDCRLSKTLNGEMAYEVDPRRATGLKTKEASRPRWILFLERTETQGCALVPCDREYVVEFFERSAELLPEELREAQLTRSRIIRLLSECPAWILRTGESPQRTAAAIDEFLLEAHYATA